MGTAAAVTSEDFIEYESSNVHSGRFDPARKVIIVRFHNGSSYEYPGCDLKLWKDMNKAPSVGKFVSQQLSKKPYTKIEDWK